MEKALTRRDHIPILRPHRCPAALLNEAVAPVSTRKEPGANSLTDQRAVLEFSRPVKVAAVDLDGMTLCLDANDAECTALAKRLDLRSLSNLRAELSCRRTAEGLIRLNVKISANVVQSCVVSLDLVTGQIVDRFSVLCEGDGVRGPERTAKADVDGEFFLDPYGDDPLEPLADGKIDAGELVAQHLSLAINPYPRASGLEVKVDIAYPEYDGDPGGVREERENPFSALAGCREGKENSGAT